MLWFTKNDNYTFNLNSIRVPSKYPGKRHYKPGKNYGKLSGNPLGKNPSDIWQFLIKEWEIGLWNIPNVKANHHVKANHPEKTLHPCQFPIELVERCILACTHKNDIVLDPFSGGGTAILTSLKLNRKAIACEMEQRYIEIAKDRIRKFDNDELPYRRLGKPVHQPSGKEKDSQILQEQKQINKLV